MSIPTIRIVVATRADADHFVTDTALGKSLRPFLRRFPFIQVNLFPDNSTGLPAIYNSVIDAARDEPSILVFAHDDIHLCDFFWFNQVMNGLGQFDIIGLAGNRRRVPRQPAWLFVDDSFAMDKVENLSGVVGHGTGIPDCRLSIYGPTCQQVKLIDGLFMACRSATLVEHDIRFDERFDFHFYDLDFCRQAEARGLKIGTWPISVVHESRGSFRNQAWRAAYARYLEKWGD